METNRKDILKAKLADSHLPLSVKVHMNADKPPELVEVLVRKELPLRDLMRQIVRKYAEPGMIESDYMLYDDETRQPVEMQKSLYQVGHERTFALLHRSRTQAPAVVHVRAPTLQFAIELREEKTGTVMPIDQLPAIIGRVKRDQTISDLAVDLGGFEFGRTVSGKHARISRDEDYYYIENLTEDNRLLVESENGEQHQVRYMQPQVIQNGDVLHIGKVSLRCIIRD